MPSILESVAELLGRGDTFAKLGSLIGGDAKQAETAVETAGPALLGGLAEQVTDDDGAAALGSLLDEADTSILDDPGAWFDRLREADEGRADEVEADAEGDEADGATGEGVVSALFGGDREALLDGLASRSGLGSGLFAKLLPALAPVFLGILAKRRADDGLDAAGLARLVTDEREGLEKDGKLGDWFSNLALGGGALAAAVAARGRIAAAVSDAGDEIEDALEKVGGVLGGLKDRITGDDDDDEAEDAADDDDDDDDDDDAADADDADDDDDDEDDDDADDDEDDDDGAGGGVKAAAAAAALAGGAAVAAKAGGTDAGDEAAATVDEAAAAADTAGDKADDEARDEARDKAAAVAGAGKGAAAVTTAKVVDAGGGARGGWLRWVIGAAALIAVLALALTQCGGDDGATSADTSATGSSEAGSGGSTATTDDGGATTEATEKATTTASTAATTATTAAATTTSEATTTTAPAADLDAAVQAALKAADLGTGITATVGPDGVVTLAGTVETEEAKAAAEKAMATVAGVTKVVNNITVTPPGGAAAAGTDLNDTLKLAPVNFDYLSSRITPGAAAVLDQVVAYLQANPVNVEVQGHTDADGPENKNQELSQARAESVKAYLVSKGIDANRLSTVGFGESKPKVPNDSLENKALNRRIEFIVK